jgi:hypothetical protein
VYKLTFFNLGNQDGVCYLWNETDGKRAGIEMASCIYDYVMTQLNIKQVRMVSDGCGGQQKNMIFASLCMALCQDNPNSELIDHKFFETGHSEMECDSIHSKIEKTSTYVPVYVPQGWAQIIRSCRKNPRPFVVCTMLNDDFLNFKVNSKKVPKIPM